MSRNDRRGSNWLLPGLLLLSLAVHAILLGPLASRYRSAPASAIELELSAPRRLDTRSIPVPPQRRPPPRVAAPMPAVLAASPPLPTAPPPPDLSGSGGRQSLMETIAAPERPQFARTEALSWNAAGKDASGGLPGVYGSSGDYFSMVQMSIESRKSYPPEARRRQMEGRVVVRFTIQRDGSVDRVELGRQSPHPLLDEAALEAVRSSAPFPRPPESLFKGPVALEIAMVFELT